MSGVPEMLPDYGRFAEAIRQVWDLDLPDGAANWTQALHEAIAKVALDALSASCRAVAWSKSFDGRRPRFQHGEYLVDLAVSLEPDNCEPADYLGQYRGLALAAETEWNPRPGRLQEDLVKLADVRAHRRIMVNAFASSLHFDALHAPHGRLARDISVFFDRHELFDQRDTVMVAAFNDEADADPYFVAVEFRKGSPPFRVG